jgi:hypothetical protein
LEKLMRVKYGSQHRIDQLYVLFCLGFFCFARIDFDFSLFMGAAKVRVILNWIPN